MMYWAYGASALAGMERDVALRGRDGLVVFLRFVMCERRHQQRLARPLRIRMLTVDFLEALGGGLVVLLVVQKEQALVVEPVSRIVRNVDVVLAAPEIGDRADELQAPSGTRQRATANNFATARGRRSNRTM